MAALARAKAWLYDIFAHNHAENLRTLRAVGRKVQGVDMTDQPYPGSGNQANPMTVNNSNGGLARGALLGSALLVAGVAGTLGLTKMLSPITPTTPVTTPTVAAPVPQITVPVPTVKPVDQKYEWQRFDEKTGAILERRPATPEEVAAYLQSLKGKP